MYRPLRIAFTLWSALLISGCTLTNATVTPEPTPDLPGIFFQFPENGSSVFEGTDLSVELVAQDETAGVARVELLIDEQLHQESSPVDADTVSVFTVSMNWLAVGPGNHTLTAIAYRQDGTPSIEETIVVEVLPRNATPTPDAVD